MAKENVTRWETATTYTATFNSATSIGACTVEVQVGTDSNAWYIRTTDDAGGSDECDDTAYETLTAACIAANEYAKEHDEMSDNNSSAITQQIEAGKDPKGQFALISSQDHTRWDFDRYSDADTATLAVGQWYAAMQATNPGTRLSWQAMDCPIVGKLINKTWVPVEEDD